MLNRKKSYTRLKQVNHIEDIGNIQGSAIHIKSS